MSVSLVKILDVSTPFDWSVSVIPPPAAQSTATPTGGGLGGGMPIWLPIDDRVPVEITPEWNKPDRIPKKVRRRRQRENEWLVLMAASPFYNGG